MSEFVEPKIIRIPLSGDNRWIDVKKELSAGEHDAMMASICKKDVATPDGNPIPDFEKTPSYQILAYVVGWSFTDHNGPVPVSAGAVENLKVSTREELRKVIAKHDAESVKGITDRKNEQGDELASPPSLLSAVQ